VVCGMDLMDAYAQCSLWGHSFLTAASPTGAIVNRWSPESMTVEKVAACPPVLVPSVCSRGEKRGGGWGALELSVIRDRPMAIGPTGQRLVECMALSVGLVPTPVMDRYARGQGGPRFHPPHSAMISRDRFVWVLRGGEGRFGTSRGSTRRLSVASTLSHPARGQPCL